MTHWGDPEDRGMRRLRLAVIVLASLVTLGGLLLAAVRFLGALEL